MSEESEEADILIDVHEPRRIGDKISSLGLKVKYEKLGVGDYVWGDTAVERKTLRDFISSIGGSSGKSPRIWKQAKGLSDNFEHPFIIISGTSLDISYKKRYRSKTIYGTMAALQLGFDIQVCRVENETELIDFIFSLWNRTKKGTSDRPYPSTPAKAPLKQRVENAICQAQRVGIKTTQKLLKEKPSLESIIELEKEELQDIIGKVAGENLYKVLHKEVDYED